MADYLSPWEIAQSQNRDNQYRTNYQNSLASNEYQRTRLGLQNSMARDNYDYSWDQSRQKLPGNFVGRGIYGSGIWKQALGDYANQRFRGSAQMATDYATNVGQTFLGDQNAGDVYNTGLSGTASDMAARRAELATKLRDL